MRFACSPNRLWTSAIFRPAAGMNCPPTQPGLIIIRRMTSISSKTYLMASGGVAGFSATPGRAPCWRISPKSLGRCMVASAWITMISAPASAKTGMYGSGLASMRWTSNGNSVTCRTALTNSGASPIRGTRLPSIMSKCNRSIPPSSKSRTSCSTCNGFPQIIDAPRIKLLSPVPRVPSGFQRVRIFEPRRLFTPGCDEVTISPPISTGVYSRLR